MKTRRRAGFGYIQICLPAWYRSMIWIHQPPATSQPTRLVLGCHAWKSHFLSCKRPYDILEVIVFGKWQELEWSVIRIFPKMTEDNRKSNRGIFTSPAIKRFSLMWDHWLIWNIRRTNREATELWASSDTSRRQWLCYCIVAHIYRRKPEGNLSYDVECFFNSSVVSWKQ